MNTLKWALVILMIALGVAANYHFSDQSLLIRVIGLLVLAAIAVAIALQTDKGKRFWEFSLESRNELRKVIWPNRQETIQTTAMVLGMVAILGVILWGVDTLLLNVVARIIGYGAT
jgi:preprotein translocase subunit SecE